MSTISDFFGGNNKITVAAINLGSTKSRGSSTRMFNYSNKSSVDSSEYINQFINISLPSPHNASPMYMDMERLLANEYSNGITTRSYSY